ncbi:HNH endonuclease [Sutterella sp.]|uniref:HNH endonuclease n=1 Tax=Sutterella sp. TaxID=1981025 RepID=UPI003FD8492B
MNHAENLPNHRYLIKKCGHQELGSQDERGGKAKRGRYLLIQKGFLSFLPYLSETNLNDAAIIEIDPVFKLGGVVPPNTYCMWIYHNSKVVGDQNNGRNEHRIYLSRKLDAGQLFQGDIVVFRRNFDQTRRDEGDADPEPSKNSSFRFYFDWLRPEVDKEAWELCNKILTQKRSSNTSVFYDGSLKFFEDHIVSNQSQGIAVDKKVTETVKEINKNSSANGDPLAAMSKLFTTGPIFRNFVMANYGNNCAVTQECIVYEDLNNLEAAHIHPKCHGGTYLPQNGIAMRRDVHWAFDKGMFYIDPHKLTVCVHDDIKSSYLGRYDGVVIKPLLPGFEPRPEFLEYHKNNIYGLFKSSGSLAKAQATP